MHEMIWHMVSIHAECTPGRGDCPRNADCEFVDGDFRCVCDARYREEDEECKGMTLLGFVCRLNALISDNSHCSLQNAQRIVHVTLMQPAYLMENITVIAMKVTQGMEHTVKVLSPEKSLFFYIV